MRLEAGQLLGERYVISGALGRGGMATTYRAVDRLWSVEVVLKLVSAPTAALLEAFRFEFDTLRSLEHPRLTRVYDLVTLPGGEHQGDCFYTAELIEGVTLDDHARGATWEELRRPLCDALEALRVLHAAKIGHGDLKPENILVDGGGRGVLIDLGCAKPLDAPDQAPGGVYGSRGFLAPELLAGAALSRRADLYALGVTLERLAPLLAEPLPSPVAELIHRLTAERPADRPVDVAEVLQGLGLEAALLHPVVLRLGHLVGRDRALTAARGALDGLLQGQPAPRVIHLHGPEGVGRSRLLREIKWTAQPRCRVLEANPRSPTCLADLLARTGPAAEGPPSSTAEAITAWERLTTSVTSPVVWVIDDIDLLDDRNREILDVLIRLSSRQAPILLALTSLATAALTGPALLDLPLEPLGPEALEAWVGPTVSRRAREQLHLLSGGLPAALRVLLRQLVAGQITEEELGSRTRSVSLSSPTRAAIGELSGAAQRALGFLAIAGRGLSRAELSRLGVERDALETLVDRGLVEASGAGWKLLRLGAGAQLLETLPQDTVRALRLEMSGWYQELAEQPGVSRERASELLASQALQLSGAGALGEATAALLGHQGLLPLAPRGWWLAAEALASQVDDPEVGLVAATLERAVGRAQAALERLEGLLVTPLSPALELRAQVELGACLLRLGRFSRAASHLRGVLERARGGDQAGAVTLLLVRALTNQRAYDEAALLAEEALSSCESPAFRAELLEAAGVARSYSGDLPRARALLDEALALVDALDDPRRRVRLQGSGALIAFAQGDLRVASEAQRRSLELAEASGLSDQVATAALNLGTITHQQGRWAEALSSYERGLRMATALGQESTEAHLRLNLSNLYAELGLSERALEMATRCVEVSRRRGQELVVALAEVVRAEVMTTRGDLAGARAILELALSSIAQVGSARERAELDLQLAELEVTLGELAGARARLEGCAQAIEHLGARDVTIRRDLARAHLLLEGGDPGGALELAEAAVRSARVVGQRSLEAEAELTTSRAWERQGAPTTAERHRRRATELWEQCLAGLPSGLGEAFWAHPRRAVLRGQDERTTSAGLRESKYLRLLEINKRLNSSLKAKQVLDLAIDAAIELTLAERGFVLLADPGAEGELRVAVARNLDREELGRSQMKFSRGIAEGVIRDNSPLITSDAQADGRFPTGSSVHAMHLKSVVCVPVTSPEGVLGALYLDNRFQRGLFSADDVELLGAFADQVAIALGNARLHEELGRRNRDLLRERRRVEELLKGQAEEISRLTEEVQRQRTPTRRRFDFSEIVGTSRRLEDVFDLLDRVIDTDLPILITGESGTGKELVARAIHRNSPASAGRLVSINCGALPEALLESELFGYEKGAFTGAERPRDGLVVQARGGSLFLDEVGEMPRTMQVKLLRVLQEREVQPLGSSRVVPVDFRLICATNRHLRQEVSDQRFREDLFYRISAVEVPLPPLRERSEDIPQLVAHILTRVTERMGRPPAEVTRQALRKMSGYDWPGNVRQLEHVLTKAVVLAEGSGLTAADIELPEAIEPPRPGLSRKAFEEAEIERIAQALAENRWNIAKVSRLLGIPRPTLYRRIARYGLDRR